MTAPLSLDEIRAAARQLSDRIVVTPIHRLGGPEAAASLGPNTDVLLKLELFQHTGTFKARGALLNVLGLTEAQRERGVTAISAGNHAVAVAFAAGCSRSERQGGHDRHGEPAASGIVQILRG